MVLPSDELRNAFGLVPPVDPVTVFTESVGQATAQLFSAQIFGWFKDPTASGQGRPAQSVDVSDDAEKAIRERIRQTVGSSRGPTGPDGGRHRRNGVCVLMTRKSAGFSY